MLQPPHDSIFRPGTFVSRPADALVEQGYDEYRARKIDWGEPASQAKQEPAESGVSGQSE